MPDKRHDAVTDPKRLRALAHPLRWKIINLVDSEGSATATRCAEVLGESVASCSYHLNMLAKYNFVEEAPGGQGREKPWQLTTRSQSFSGEGLGPEGQLAAEAASGALVDYEFDNIKSLMRHKSLEPQAWRKATGLAAAGMYLTADETAALRKLVMDYMESVADRWDEPELRPEGAREVRIFLSTFVAPPRPPKN
jgi:predicted ArsR family transcriptional regulator